MSQKSAQKPKKPSKKHKKGEKELIEHLQRTQAEFENYKKMVEKDRNELGQRASREIILELTHIIDNFELALGHLEKDIGKKKSEGIEMMHRQMLSLLEKNGVKQMPKMKKFNPQFQEALMTRREPGKKDHEVLEIVQKGYLIGEKLLRSEKVIVNKLD